MRTSLKAIDIDLQKGHKIERRISEEFVPYCGTCQQPLLDYTAWYTEYNEAYTALEKHLSQHNWLNG